MTITSLNINDFGGTDNILKQCKKVGRYGREVTAWRTWAEIDKSKPINYVKSLAESRENSPDVLIIQEYEMNNSKETMDLIKWMKEKGYNVKGVIPDYKISMTVIFVKEELSCTTVEVPHVKSGITSRDYAVKVDGCLIYGTHVPLNSIQRPHIREKFWDDIISFYESNCENEIVLIGDFNTYDKSSEAYKKYTMLTADCGAIDLWLDSGHPDPTATERKYRERLDYVFISPSVKENYYTTMIIDQDTMDKDEITDHALISLTLKRKDDI